MRSARVARVQVFGGPEVLALDRLDLPPPRPGEVLVRTGAVGLNRIEALYRAGGFGAPALPARIGYEAAGVVEAVGPEARRFKPGDRVATIPGLDMERYGTCAEAFLYPEDMLVAVPEGQPIDEAAATWMSFLTAYHLIEDRLVRNGEAVLITAASSSVGLAAIQVVGREGGVPVALTRTRAKAQALLDLGAVQVIATEEEDLIEGVKAVTQGAGAAVAFDAVAGAGLGRLVQAMAPGGAISLYGALGGDQALVPVHALMLKGLRLRGFATNQITLDPARLTRAVDYVRSGIESGAFRPVIDARFPLEEAAQAHRRLEGGEQVGKIVLIAAPDLMGKNATPA